MYIIQRAKSESYGRINILFKKYEKELAGIPECQILLKVFMALYLEFNNAIKIQEENIYGITSQIKIAKNVLANTIIRYAKRAAVTAKLAGNETLRMKLDVSVTYIAQASKEIAAQRASDIRDAMFNNMDLFKSITPEIIAEMDKAIADFSGMKDASKVANQEKTTKGTNDLKQLSIKLDDTIDSINDLIYSYYITDNSNMVEEFALARHLNLTGKRHTSLHFGIKDENGIHVTNAKVLDVSNSKVYKANELGIVEIAKHRHGYFHFVITADGKVDVDLEVSVERSSHNEYEVKMFNQR